MNEYLFEHIDYDNDPEWVIKDFFNSMNLQNKFLWMLPYLINKIGCGVNETYCNFPDWNDQDSECHFEGIMFGVWGGEIIVSEQIGFKYIRIACKKYLSLHPEDTEEINELLAKIPL
ncbi:ribonuclease toxin immunity protein CdiI [Orbus mooreae]|uniref:ribonuclease toxin immunity protein CdiI n=1 Tax=Orbus mooreae TaxID=3074107 RepID=UPI00370D93E5